jgi:hypothetical protein
MTIPQIDPLYWGGDDIGREAVIKKGDTFSLVIGLWRSSWCKATAVPVASPYCFIFSARGGFADAEQLRGAKDAPFRHLKGLFEGSFFKVVDIEGFWEGE